MGRIDLDLAADRQSLWEAAAAVLPDAEGEPGRQLLWGELRMDLVATGRGGTQVRLHHPGGLLASLRWRWWLWRLGSSPWGAAEKLALAAALLTLAGGMSLVAPEERVVVESAGEAATIHSGSLSSAVLVDGELRIDRAFPFAQLPEPPRELALRDDGLWVDGRTRIPFGTPAEGGGWRASLDGGALTLVHANGRELPVVPPAEHGHIQLATVRGSNALDQLLAYAVGTEVVVVALPALRVDLESIVASVKGRPLPREVTMRITSRSGQTRTRTLATGPDFLEVLEPSDVAGTRVVWSEDGMSLYMPAYKRWNEIAGMGRKGNFLGSALSFEDLDLLWLTPPAGEHELVEQTATSWVIETRLEDSPQYAAIRWRLRYDSDAVSQYELIDRDGERVRRLMHVDGHFFVWSGKHVTSLAPSVVFRDIRKLRVHTPDDSVTLSAHELDVLGRCIEGETTVIRQEDSEPKLLQDVVLLQVEDAHGDRMFELYTRSNFKGHNGRSYHNDCFFDLLPSPPGRTQPEAELP